MTKPIPRSCFFGKKTQTNKHETRFKFTNCVHVLPFCNAINICLYKSQHSYVSFHTNCYMCRFLLYSFCFGHSPCEILQNKMKKIPLLCIISVATNQQNKLGKSPLTGRFIRLKIIVI